MSESALKYCCCCDASDWNTTNYKLLDVCQNCGLGVAKEMPSEKELIKHYQKDYFFGDEYVDYVKDRKALEKNFKRRSRYLLSLFNKKPKVCEIGSAYGFFLKEISPHSAKTIGFELGEDGVNYANKNFRLNTSTQDFLKTKLVEKQDIIVMWDVIEHLRHPEAYIKKIANNLDENGVVSLTTGDFGAFVARKQGDNWRMIHPPTHLYYFTLESLKTLLSKHGLTVINTRYPTHYRNVGSVIGMLILDAERKGKNTYLLSLIERFAGFTRLSKLNFGINTKDLVMLTARKQ